MWLRIFEENQLQTQGIVDDPYLATMKRYAQDRVVEDEEL